MDLRSSHQSQDSGLRSWHPAMRSNTYELEANREQVDEPLTPLNDVDGDAALHGVLHQPNCIPPERPVPTPAEEHEASTAIPREPEPLVNDTTGISLDGDMIGGLRNHEQHVEDDGDDRATLNAADIEADGAGLTDAHPDPGRVAEEPEQEAAQLEVGSTETSATSFQNSDHTEDAFGEKEEIDKAFESEHTAFGPGALSRTNSFPNVPPIGQIQAVPPLALPHSQAEDIMEEDDKTNDLGYGQSTDNLPFTNGDVSARHDTSESELHEEDESFFANHEVPDGVSAPEAEEESRYEEGLPLIPSEPQHDQPSFPQSLTSNAEATGFPRGENGDQFFDKVATYAPEDTSLFKPHPLGRKSTTQVLDTLHYAPHSASHAEPESVDERPSLADLTGGGIAVSASTVKSQAIAEQQQMDLAHSIPKDDDLAEMWKAALGDDDLLEEDGTSVDPSGFFGDDDEGFLEGSEDLADETGPQSVGSPPILEPIYGLDGKMQGFGLSSTGPASAQNKYLPASTFPPRSDPSASYYGGQQLPQVSPGPQNPVFAQTGFANAIGQQAYTAQTSYARPQMPASTQSFADKSKGGYTSPYDIPMDVTRPKRRPTNQQVRPNSDAQTTSRRPPPPRSSSIFTDAPPQTHPQPPLPAVPNAYLSGSVGDARPPPLKASPSTGGFFEELMPSSKPRPSTSIGRAIPPASRQTPPPTPPMSSQVVPPRQSFTPQPVSRVPATSQPYQLLPPERMSIYGNEHQAQAPRQALPITNTRYSPAPPQPSNVPPTPNRYAASPASGIRPPPPQALLFQPRTSSPLAQHNSLPHQSQQNPIPNGPSRRPQSSGNPGRSLQNSMSPSYPFPSHQGPQTVDSTYDQEQDTGRMPNQTQLTESPPSVHPSPHAPLSNTPSDSSYVMKTPEPDQFSLDGSTSFQQSHDVRTNALGLLNHGPPQRSQTESPGTARYRPEIPTSSQNPYQRPASVNHQASSPSTETGLQAVSPPRPRGRTFSKTLNHIKPTDGRERDHLERWKGCPIFSFGFGGSIVTSFPKQVPRYAAGQSTPMIKCSPGEVKIQDATVLPLSEDIAAFPGPLKLKSKKKDVLEWLQKRIYRLKIGVSESSSSVILPDPRKRYEEKILLWTIVRVLVEHDGVIDGSPLAEKDVRTILSPASLEGDSTDASRQSFDAPLVGISGRSGSHSVPGSVSVEAIEELRKILLNGEREKAVWHAVDNRLWAHAMLLSSTLDKGIWKQVSQEFVRQGIKTFGENTESLAALYQIFAGNWEESVDELVSPSARAGLQMVSKSANVGPTKNALDGLDRWRETLTLILSNRTTGDGKALVALGQLLAAYGRTEAAHICFLFAKAPSLFGGPDDPQVSIALLGADHLQHPSDYGRDFDSILLTEVYDFARTVLASSSAATVAPHLQSYRLYHAMTLAEHGHKLEAQQYCEVITSALNSTTKRSPYYHNLLLGALDNLVDRLRQAPMDTSGSWISKPSIDKVSGSLWAKFNQYVAGDESDAASTGSGRAHDHPLGSAVGGPFARVTGDSPNLSRTPSSSELYGSYAPGVGVGPSAPMPNPTNSRYAPAGLYTPRSSLEQPGRSVQDLQRLTPNDSLRPVSALQQYQSRPASSAGSYNEAYKFTPPTSSYAPQTDSYLPTPPSQPEYMPVAPPDDLTSSLYQREPYQQTPPLEPQSYQELYQPQSEFGASDIYEPPPSMDMAPLSAYGPPPYDPQTTSSYDPPSYAPEASQANESPGEEKRKKKSLKGDDEDGFEARAAALRKEEKARKDREAEEAFRRAAEADGKFLEIRIIPFPADFVTAQKDNAPKLNGKKSGWFGGWLGSKKEGDAAPGTPNAPIKAKLGEQSSFYYDAEKKRWIDKKNPDLAPAATAPPPPPKGPPSRAVSAAGALPPISTSTPPVPLLPMATVTPPVNGAKPTPSHLPSSGPLSQHQSRSQSPAIHPSEETTTETRSFSMLMTTGPPSGPPSAPPSRPGTGMSGANNIDDLIGAPQARKGGTVRKAKKGRGYVDVMAK